MLPSRGTGGHTSEAGAKSAVEKRVEADLVRFSATKLPSGLYRHRPVKFIFQIADQRRKGRL